MALRGSFDLVSRRGVAGWAQDEERPEERVRLIVTADDEVVGRIVASLYRADLETAGIGDGRHAFELAFDTPLPPRRQTLRVHRAGDDQDIPGSPRVLDPPAAFDAEARAEVTKTLAHFGSPADLEAKIEFLAAELADLLQGRSDRDSARSERWRNRDLLRRWRWRLPPFDEPRETEAPPAPVRRALVVGDVAPRRGRDGAEALIGLMASLRRLGYEVAFAASQGFAREAATPDAALAGLGVIEFRWPFYASIEEVMLRAQGEFDCVVLHKASNGGRYAELARAYFPAARLVYAVGDLHALRLSRQAGVEKRPELLAESRRAQRRELTAMMCADAVLTASRFEADLLPQQLPPSLVHVTPWEAPIRPAAPPLSQRRGLAFIGDFGHAPDLDAARWLIDAIMPAARRRAPDLVCLIVGADLPADLAALCGAGCVALGPVDDLAEVFDRVRLTVAPLAFGAGVKSAIIDSLAGGAPCVLTPLAAEGLDLPPALAPCVAATTEEIAATIVRLHDDPEELEACGRAGLAYVAERYSPARVDDALRRALKL